MEEEAEKEGVLMDVTNKSVLMKSWKTLKLRSALLLLLQQKFSKDEKQFRPPQIKLPKELCKKCEGHHVEGGKKCPSSMKFQKHCS